MIAANRTLFEVKKIAEGVLAVKFGDNSVTFFDDRIEVVSDTLLLYSNSLKARSEISVDGLSFEYKGHEYRLIVDGAMISECDGNIVFTPTGYKTVLYPKVTKGE